MTKRLATTAAESTKLTKSVKLTGAEEETAAKSIALDFAAELDQDWRKQVAQAVAAALPADSLQPIILVLEDTDVDDTLHYAYNPASQEVGEWLLQALELLSWKKPSLHYALTAVIHDDGEADVDVASLLADYLGGRIKERSDLGRFRVLLTADEDLPNEDHPELFVNVTALNFALYHQRCQYDHTFSGEEEAEEESGDDDDEGEDDDV